MENLERKEDEERQMIVIDLMDENPEEAEVERSDHVVNEDSYVPTANHIVDQLESRLNVGEVVKSVEDAYLLYCSYAHAKGFSVKKGDQRYFPGTNELQAKEFECSCEGSKDEKRSTGRVPVYLKPTRRSQCRAKLRVSRERDGEWKVGRFVKEHNHDMVAFDRRHLLRSSRSISYAKKSTLEAMVNAGISVSSAAPCVESEGQGQENSRVIGKDASDHLSRSKKQTNVENGDASALLRHFINRSNKESNFYWNVQLDEDNRVKNFFIRDSRCQADYECFGDVLSIDATYRTNRCSWICAPFVGINQHMQNVMFGLAFLSDEAESSFEWLFKIFLDSMNGKEPETIFTDQCQAMMNAVDVVFKNSYHRLCQRQINQNAQSHLGSFNSSSNLKSTWKKLMSLCESEEEFESTWRTMIDAYDLGGHKWLNDMYPLRHKWATAFSNHKFSAGLSATSRSEVTSAVLKRLGNSAITLYDFVLDYEKIQTSWREKEKAEDTRCHQTKAPTIIKNNPLLNSVADVYTHTVYKLFELELIDSLNMRFVEMPSDLSAVPLEFKVKSHDNDSRVRKVVINRATLEVECSCKKFESMGILCKHVLTTFNFMNVNFIPIPYLKKRWMKNAKDRYYEMVFADESTSGRESEIVFVNQTMRSMYALTMQCKVHESSRKRLTEILDSARKEMDVLLRDLKLDGSEFSDRGVRVEELRTKTDSVVGVKRVREGTEKEQPTNQVSNTNFHQSGPPVIFSYQLGAFRPLLGLDNDGGSQIHARD